MSVAALVGTALLGCQGEELPVVGKKREQLQGGNILGEPNSMRSGAVMIAYGADGDPNSFESCSATIISTSAIRQRTWVLTAGHCVCRGENALRRPEGQLLGVGGIAFKHPLYTCNQVLPHDLALMRFPFGVDVKNDRGEAIQEHFRPVLQSSPLGITLVPFGAFGSGRNQYRIPGKCDWDVQDDDDTNRWASSSFGVALFGNIATGTPFQPAGSLLAMGDSGGGWLVTPVVTEENLVSRGVVAGVSSLSNCLLGQNTAEAASTWDSDNLAFLMGTLGPDFHGSTSTTWNKTCDENWCQYTDSEKASLLAALW